MGNTQSAAQFATAAAPGPPASPFKRLTSLDMLRGITIAFMIMVNNNGGDHAWAEMRHAAWNGFTATDLVFPTFLFVVGVSIVFATQARLARGQSRGQLAGHTVRRACILFAFGLVVNNYPLFHLEHMRFYGVLQRIAVCYLIVELFYLWDRRASTKVLTLLIVLLGYWALVRLVPVPGAGVPGRDIPFLDKNQNIVAWVDRHLMPGHLYEDWPTHNARDPEGLLSDIPAIGTTLIGLLAGLWLRSNKSLTNKSLGLAVAGASSLAIGYLWSEWFPLNKKMWTSSYVLVAAGWSLALLTLMFWMAEERGWCKKGVGKVFAWPWLVFGSNAIVAYMISELIGGTFDLVHFTVGGRPETPFHLLQVDLAALIPDPGWAAFAYSVVYAAICFIPVWILYRKKIFLKV